MDDIQNNFISRMQFLSASLLIDIKMELSIEKVTGSPWILDKTYNNRITEQLPETNEIMYHHVPKHLYYEVLNRKYGR